MRKPQGTDVTKGGVEGGNSRLSTAIYDKINQTTQLSERLLPRVACKSTGKLR